MNANKNDRMYDKNDRAYDTTEPTSPNDAELSQAELDQAAGGMRSYGKEDAAVQRTDADEGKSDRQY